MLEAYRIGVSDSGGLRRRWDVLQAASIYPAAHLAADSPGGGAAIIEVAQLRRRRRTRELRLDNQGDSPVMMWIGMLICVKITTLLLLLHALEDQR